MTEPLQSLIDKQDTSEIVRDQIALILATDVAQQMILAAAAGKDPLLWKLKIFTERSNPWACYQERELDDTAPIVNVWHESATYDGTKGNVVSRQQARGRYNIDIVAIGESRDGGDVGHIAGDKAAALNVARAVRLVRNILMASSNVYLQLPKGTVGKRWLVDDSRFQPDQSNEKNLSAARLIFEVDYNELSPQFEGETLELIHVDIHRAEDGQIIIEAEYPQPPPP